MNQHTIGLVVLAAGLIAGLAALWGSGKARPHASHAGEPQLVVASAAEAAADRATETRRSPETAQVAEPWFHGAPIGRRLRFALELTHVTSIDSPAAGNAGRATPQGAHLRGELALHVVDRRADEILFAVCFDGLRVEPLEGQPREHVATDDAALRELGDGVLVRAGVDGNARGCRFAPGAGFIARNLARNVLAAISFAVPADAGARWVVREADAAGEYDAEYATDAEQPAEAEVMEVTRGKDRYATAAPTCLESRTSAGRGQATFARELGWLRSARFDETSTAKLAGVDLRIETRMHGELQLLDATDGVLAPRTRDLAGPWAAVRGDQEDSSALAAAEVAADWRRRLEGVTLADLVAEVQALTAAAAPAGDLAPVFERLSWWLRLEATRPSAALELLASGRVSDAAGDVLIDALGAAGSDDAQRALLALRGDAGRASTARQRATVAMFQIATPTPELLGAVFDSVGQAATFGELEATSLLLVGALCLRADGSAFESLVAFEDRARSLGVTDVWLESLGNAGAPRALELARPYLHSTDENLRAAAVTAIRKLRSPEAVSALAQRAVEDEAVWVRRRAVEELAGFPSCDFVEVLGQVLARDADESVRRASLLGLGSAIDADARARALVATAAASDPSASLRELAQNLLRASPGA